MVTQVCEDLLEKMANQKGSNKKIAVLLPFLGRIGKESSFPLIRLLLPEVADTAVASSGLFD